MSDDLSDSSPTSRGLRWLWLAVRPSWGLLLAIAVTCGWRALMLVARAAEIQGPLQTRDAAKGFAWDALLVLALFGLARTSAALVTDKSLQRLAIVPWAGLAVASTVVRAFDLGHCYLARSHFTAESFHYLEGGYFDRAWSGRALAMTAVLVAVAVLQARLVSGDARKVADFAGQAPRRWLAALASLALVLPAARVLVDQVRWPPHEYALRLVPESNLWRQWQLYAADAQQRAQTRLPEVPDEAWQRLRSSGLVPKASTPQSPWPIYRSTLREPPLPYAARRGAPQQPDVVLTLMESTNAVFVHELSGKFKGLMPELSLLARQMTVVQGYHNTTSPTIAGMVASLCSVFPPTHPADLRGQPSKEGQVAYTCLSEVLRSAGYRTVFISGSDNTGLSTDKFLLSHGFDEVHGDRELMRLHAGTLRSEMGFHDDLVLDYARQQIERLEAQKAKDGRPFFVMVMTLDTHEPGLPMPGCDLPRNPEGRIAVEGVPDDPSGQRALTAYHCSDREIGKFGKFLLAPGRKERLLWALSADHAAFRTLANDSVFKGLGVGWSFDRLPLLIHDPRHDLPPQVEVLSGSLDVAPTLLHLLELDDTAGSMTGYSVFGRRRELPFLVGRVGTRRAWVHNGQTAREVAMGELGELCARKEPLLDKGANPLDACDLDRYFRWQDALWALGRLQPPAGSPQRAMAGMAGAAGP